MKEKKIELDLTQKHCHVCGHPVAMNKITGIMQCVYYACKIKGIEFSIPAKLDLKK